MTQSPPTYLPYFTISGLAGPILCLTVSDDGKLTAGATAGTRLWRISDRRRITTPSASGARGATTAMTWITREDEPDDVLMFGTQSGTLVGWKEVKQADEELSFHEVLCLELALPSEITSITFEPSSNRLAVCNRNSDVQLFSVNSHMVLSSVFTVVIENHIPKAVAFEQGQGHSHDILSFGLYDGKIHTLKGDTGKVERTVETGGMIGNAQLDIQRSILCLDDPSQGAALYKADSKARVRSYMVPVKRAMRPRQVAFAKDCSKIVIGIDHGKVYVFNRRKGAVVEELLVGEDRMWVQTVTAVDILGTPFIIAAKSQDDSKGREIYLWKKAAKVPLIHEAEPEGKNWTSWLINFALIVTSVAFVCQNIGTIRMLGGLNHLISPNIETGMADVIYLP